MVVATDGLFAALQNLGMISDLEARVLPVRLRSLWHQHMVMDYLIKKAVFFTDIFPWERVARMAWLEMRMGRWLIGLARADQTFSLVRVRLEVILSSPTHRQRLEAIEQDVRRAVPRLSAGCLVAPQRRVRKEAEKDPELKQKKHKPESPALMLDAARFGDLPHAGVTVFHAGNTLLVRGMGHEARLLGLFAIH